MPTPPDDSSLATIWGMRVEDRDGGSRITGSSLPPATAAGVLDLLSPEPRWELGELAGGAFSVAVGGSADGVYRLGLNSDGGFVDLDFTGPGPAIDLHERHCEALGLPKQVYAGTPTEVANLCEWPLVITAAVPLEPGAWLRSPAVPFSVGAGQSIYITADTSEPDSGAPDQPMGMTLLMTLAGSELPRFAVRVLPQ